MKKIILLVALIVFSVASYSQQDMNISKNVFNGLLLNPGFAGSHPYFSAGLLFRSQWAGFIGAPTSQMLEFDGPLAKETMGVGLVVSNDDIGVTHQTDIYGSYAYKLKIGKGKLSMGIRAGATTYQAKLTELTIWDNGDNAFQNDITTYFIPKFGFGLYYYNQKYYAGLAFPTLIAYDKNYNFVLDVEKSSFYRRHYYLTGGYLATLNDKFKLKPAMMAKYVPAAPVQVDISASMIYKEMFVFGLGFRTGDAIVGMLEYHTSQRIRIGYAYDFTFSPFRSQSGGSHEIVLGYDFGAGKDQNVSPRFF